MQVTLTDTQREHVFNILQTHLHNMRKEAIDAHGSDRKRYEFYQERVERTQALIPLFESTEKAAIEEDEEDSEEEEEEEED